MRERALSGQISYVSLFKLQKTSKCTDKEYVVYCPFPHRVICLAFNAVRKLFSPYSSPQHHDASVHFPEFPHLFINLLLTFIVLNFWERFTAKPGWLLCGKESLFQWLFASQQPFSFSLQSGPFCMCVCVFGLVS